jgi:hypothetical protein
MLRTNRDAPPEAGRAAWPTPDLLTNGIWRCLRWWLKRVDPKAPDPIAPFDHLTFSQEPPKEKLVLLGTATDKARRACFREGLITVAEVPGLGPLPEFWVVFMYRGGHSEMAWPAYKVNEFGVPDWCPIDADWIVSEVYTYEPGQMPPIPDPEPPLKLPELPTVIDPTKSLTGILFWGGVGLMGAYIISNRIFGK